MSDHVEAPATAEITVFLERLADGEPEALHELFPVVYDELRRIAHGQRRRGPQSAMLNTTALLNEAYLRFARQEHQVYNHREHFFAVAAKAMRRILIDEAKSRLREKRGRGADHVSLDPDELKVDQQAELLIALDQGLEKLGKFKERIRQVVEYRFFGGLTEEETAQVIGVDVRTIRRDWAKARAWLALELGSS